MKTLKKEEFIGMPFLSIHFVKDGRKPFFESADFNSSDIEKLINELKDNTKEYCELYRKVNLCVNSVILKSSAITCEKDLFVLTALREGCKGKFPFIESKLNSWIFDFCLLNGFIDEGFRVCCPLYFYNDHLIGNLIEKSLGNPSELSEEIIYGGISPFYSPCRNSSLYRENAQVYSTAFYEVIPKVIKKIYNDNGKDFLYPEKRHFKRRAFTGLMSGELSGIFIGEYIPFSENKDFTEFLGNISRYTDNLLRQGLSIKTKLPHASIDAETRKFIVETVREALPDFLKVSKRVGRKPKKQSEIFQKTVNEKPVETISLDISFENAKRLSDDSWRIASVMGAHYSENDTSLILDLESQNIVEENLTKKGETVVPEIVKNPVHSWITERIPEEFLEFFNSLTDEEIQILVCIAKGGDVDALSKSFGGMTLGFIDSINEKAADKYGDIIIDASGHIFEDYRDDLCDILQ